MKKFIEVCAETAGEKVMENRGNFKLKGFQLKRRIKETFAMFLSILMVASVISVPVKAERYSGDDSAAGKTYFGGDVISFTGSYGKIKIVPVTAPDDGIFLLRDLEPDSSTAPSVGTAGQYYYKSTFTLPSRSTLSVSLPDYYFSDGFELVYYQSSDNTEGTVDDNPTSTINLLMEYGFRIDYYGISGSLITNSSSVNVYEPTNKDDSGSIIWSAEKENVAISDYDPIEDNAVIAWSTDSGDGTAATLDGSYVKCGETVSLLRFQADTHPDGVLKLYPVHNRADGPATVSMDDYELNEDGTIPETVYSPEILKTSGDQRTYSVTYIPVSSLEKDTETGKYIVEPGITYTDESTSYPRVPGKYVVRAEAEESDTAFNADGDITERGFTATQALNTFEVYGYPSGGEVTGKSDLKYTGSAQDLVTVVQPEGGVFVFSDEEEGNFTESIPQGTDAGNYDIYYQIKGDDYYLDSEVDSLTVTIDKAEYDPVPTVTLDDWRFNESANSPAVENADDGATIKYTYKLRRAAESAYSEDVPSEVGEYVVRARIGATLNHEAVTVTDEFEILKGQFTPHLTMDDWKYGETAKTPVLQDNISGGAVTYTYWLDGEEDEYDTPPEAPGDYHVKAEIAETDEYEEAFAVADYTVSKGEITPSVSIEGWSYGQSPKEPVITGNTGHGTETVQYKEKGQEDTSYSEDVPENAGDYTIRAIIGETDYYNEAVTDPVNFTIGRASFAPTVAFVDFNYGETPADPVITGNTGGGAVSYAYRLQSATEEEYVSGLPGSTTPAGEYILKATIEETVNYPSAEATTEFTIAKATLGAHVSISNWTYGETANTPSVDKNPESATVKYEYKLKTAAASAYSETVPTDAGEYVVRATIPESTNYNEDVSTADFSIAKALISPSLSMDDWIYGETASTPVVTGNTGNGAVTYAYRLQSATEEGYTTGLPDSTTEAGDYILKASVAETDNYLDSVITDEFSILPAELSPSIEIAGWTYGDAPNTPTVYGNIESGTETIQYKAKDNEESEYTTEVPENAGIYQVRVLIAATANYKEAVSDPTEFTIAKADAYIKNETATSLSYTGEEQPLLDSSIEAEGGFLLFACGTNGSEVPIEDAWNEIIPEEVNAGDYYVWIRIIGDDNHNDMAPAVRRIKIEKAGNSLTLPAAKNLTYNAEYQQLLKAGKAEFGNVYYGFEKNGNYSDSLPEGKDAKTYTIWVKAIGDENHADIDPVDVTVTIEKKTVGLKWSDLTFKYDGKKHVPTATLTGVISGDTCKVSVSGEASTAGKHTATAEKLTNNNYVLPSSNTTTFTIGTALPTLKTAPAAKSLTENGDYQELVTAGVAVNGTLLYSFSKDKDYSTEIPKGKDAGTYTVWYKVNGNSVDGKKCYEDLDPVSLSVTIAKKPDEKKDDDNKVTTLKPGSVSISVSNAIYGGNAPTPVVTSATNDVSKASISYKPAAAPDTAFTGTMPSEVGNYVAVVTLPGNNEYTGCTATCGFSISYMQVPAGAYAIEGTQGVGGWYTSDVILEPAAGYQVSVGNRGQFTSQPVLLNEASAGASFYIKKTATGEQSAAIQIATLRIDALKPQIHDMETGGTYFTDKNGVLKGTASDKNLDKVLVDGNTVKTENDGNGNVTFDLPSGKRKQKVEVTVVDKAGNEAQIEVITAPEWMKDGIIREGDLFLEADTEYKTPEGSETWTKDGDDTTYMPGISFYADEGDVTFHKH